MGSFERVSTTAERIKTAMNLAGKRQSDVSKDTGIDKGALSHYLKGRYEPKQDAIYKIAKYLNVSEMWLWGYDCPMERQKAKEVDEETQEKNDTAVGIVMRLGSDKDFAELVKLLYKLDANQLASVKNLITSFVK